MKEALNSTANFQGRKTRKGVKSENSKKVHQRGDKVVVNGAKESLLAILRRYICKCSKHTLEKLTLKFLNQNKITASYDILVWMFIFIRKNCSFKIYSTILSEYRVKMKKKMDQDESHQSQRYKTTKKQTIAKFIQSGEILSTDYVDLTVLQKSVEALYSKGKSKENSFEKIKKYLFQRTNFDHYLQFEDSACSFSDESQQIQKFVAQNIETNFLGFSSAMSEEEISFSYPLKEKSDEVNNMIWVEVQANMSQRRNAQQQSYDLFDELIQKEDSVHSLLSPYPY